MPVLSRYAQKKKIEYFLKRISKLFLITGFMFKKKAAGLPEFKYIITGARIWSKTPTVCGQD